MARIQVIVYNNLPVKDYVSSLLISRIRVTASSNLSVNDNVSRTLWIVGVNVRSGLPSRDVHIVNDKELVVEDTTRGLSMYRWL